MRGILEVIKMIRKAIAALILFGVATSPAFAFQKNYFYKYKIFIPVRADFGELAVREVYFEKDYVRVSVENDSDSSVTYIVSVILLNQLNQVIAAQSASVSLERQEVKTIVLKFPLKNFELIESKASKFQVSAVKDEKVRVRSRKF